LVFGPTFHWPHTTSRSSATCSTHATARITPWDRFPSRGRMRASCLWQDGPVIQARPARRLRQRSAQGGAAPTARHPARPDTLRRHGRSQRLADRLPRRPPIADDAPAYRGIPFGETGESRSARRDYRIADATLGLRSMHSTPPPSGQAEPKTGHRTYEAELLRRICARSRWQYCNIAMVYTVRS
jgi:hypothetical protein